MDDCAWERRVKLGLAASDAAQEPQRRKPITLKCGPHLVASVVAALLQHGFDGAAVCVTIDGNMISSVQGSMQPDRDDGALPPSLGSSSSSANNAWIIGLSDNAESDDFELLGGCENPTTPCDDSR